ncbi:TspO/MBR family protein [Thermaurantiacus tibetensis]|uniref:TspO/MBR family protein n=1 Tax=Thermaurantiacus tibetensis TaxID=2759035 RepID=UPI002E285893|nr:TspO/MBR family protein [Thermaurantiacus tibetensis]
MIREAAHPRGRAPRVSGAALVPALVGGGAALLIAILGSTLTDTGPWYRALAKPSWTPPDAAFGAIWTVILALWGAAAVAAWRAAPDSRRADWLVGLFALNGFLNILWSLLFFRLQRPDLALLEVGLLLASILWLIVASARHSRAAPLMLLPYLAWVSVAALLNWEIVRLNVPGA